MLSMSMETELLSESASSQNLKSVFMYRSKYPTICPSECHNVEPATSSRDCMMLLLLWINGRVQYYFLTTFIWGEHSIRLMSCIHKYPKLLSTSQQHHARKKASASTRPTPPPQWRACLRDYSLSKSATVNQHSSSTLVVGKRSAVCCALA